MTRKLKNKIPFPYKILEGKRERTIDQQSSDSGWQAFFEKAEKIYYSMDTRRRMSYRHFGVNIKRALAIALEEQDKKKIAKTYALQSRFQLEVEHPDSLATFKKSIIAAQEAYGVESKEVAVQMCGLSLKYEKDGNEHMADLVGFRACQIIEKNSTPEQSILLNDIAMGIAIETKDFSSVLIGAKRGLELTKQHLDKNSQEFGLRIRHYEDIISQYT